MNKVVGGVAGLGAAGGLYYYFNAPKAVKGAPKNAAFVFVKPHAVTSAATAMVREGLEAKGISITGEGVLTSETIDKKKLIDQHYYAIASKATILKPHELVIPADKFKSTFGIEWQDALNDGLCYNALDACEHLKIDAQQMADAWDDCKKNKQLVKFGGGFYCGKVEIAGKKPIYAFNGFFMSMRSKFTAPGESIHYYTVEWDEDKLSWEDFRGKVLGPTDPNDAPADSMRGIILKDWQKLGLKSKPNTGDNGVHASASPYEAMAERMNWLEVPCRQDSFCKALVAAGVKEAMIKQWNVDPRVNLPGGKQGSLFDALEDMDASACLAKAKVLQGLN